MLVIDVKPVASLPWWLDPARITIVMVLPIFCFSAYFNRTNYSDFNASEDFLTPETFSLGLFSMALMLLGITIGRLLLRRQDMTTLLDRGRTEAVMTGIGWVTIVAYILLLGTLLTHLSLAVQLIRGNAGAGSDLRDVLGRIPGVTSFIQFDVVYMTLLSALVVLGRYRPPTRVWVMAGVIAVLTFLRAILASERLALLELIAAALVIPMAYWWKPSAWRNLAPLIGVLAIFIIFSAGEYFRSWQYYQDFYQSYGDFIFNRFFGYFSTSINNGAGAYITIAKYSPRPEITSAWVTHFPGLIKIFQPPGSISLLDRFLTNYATPEFNNPGGFYAAYLDYNFIIASLFMVGLGVVIGLIYRSFQNRSLLGLMLFPVVFLGQTDFIRLVYITDVRALPIFLGVFLVHHLLRPRQIPRNQLALAVAHE